MFARQKWHNLWLSLALLSLASVTRAESGAEDAPAPPGGGALTPGPRLEWSAPSDCPTRDEVLAQVATLGKADRLRWDRFDVIRAAIERRASGRSLALEFVAPDGVRRRAWQSARCAELAEAAAVAIVLAHQSREDAATTDWGSSAPPDSAEPPAGAAKPASTAGSSRAAGAEPAPAGGPRHRSTTPLRRRAPRRASSDRSRPAALRSRLAALCAPAAAHRPSSSCARANRSARSKRSTCSTRAWPRRYYETSAR